MKTLNDSVTKRSMHILRALHRLRKIKHPAGNPWSVCSEWDSALRSWSCRLTCGLVQGCRGCRCEHFRSRFGAVDLIWEIATTALSMSSGSACVTVDASRTVSRCKPTGAESEIHLLCTNTQHRAHSETGLLFGPARCFRESLVLSGRSLFLNLEDEKTVLEYCLSPYPRYLDSFLTLCATLCR